MAKSKSSIRGGGGNLDLRKPIELDFAKFADEHTNVENANQAIRAYVREQLSRKLVALFDEYPINTSHPDAWALLVLHLALEFHPGFKIKEKRRPGAKAKSERDVAFLFDAMELMATDGLSASEAARKAGPANKIQGNDRAIRRLRELRSLLRRTGALAWMEALASETAKRIR